MTPGETRRRRRALRLRLALLLAGLGWRLVQGVGLALHPVATPVPEVVAVDRAPAARLMLLPGIGRARAFALVRDRALTGPPRRWEDLLRVDGIGPATVARLRASASAVLVGSDR